MTAKFGNPRPPKAYLRRASVPARLKDVVRGRTTYEERSFRDRHATMTEVLGPNASAGGHLSLPAMLLAKSDRCRGFGGRAPVVRLSGLFALFFRFLSSLSADAAINAIGSGRSREERELAISGMPLSRAALFKTANREIGVPTGGRGLRGSRALRQRRGRFSCRLSLVPAGQRFRTQQIIAVCRAFLLTLGYGGCTM